jgi:hypothetical protein
VRIRDAPKNLPVNAVAVICARKKLLNPIYLGGSLWASASVAQDVVASAFAAAISDG